MVPKTAATGARQHHHPTAIAPDSSPGGAFTSLPVYQKRTYDPSHSSLDAQRYARPAGYTSLRRYLIFTFDPRYFRYTLLLLRRSLLRLNCMLAGPRTELAQFGDCKRRGSYHINGFGLPGDSRSRREEGEGGMI